MQIIEPVTHNKNKDHQTHNQQLMMMKPSENGQTAPIDTVAIFICAFRVTTFKSNIHKVRPVNY